MNNFNSPFLNNNAQIPNNQTTTPCNKDQTINNNPCNNNTTYMTCPPIVTCSKQVVNKYFVTKQPYIHEYHTEFVNHYITENEYIPKYTCSTVNVNDGTINRR